MYSQGQMIPVRNIHFQKIHVIIISCLLHSNSFNLSAKQDIFMKIANSGPFDCWPKPSCFQSPWSPFLPNCSSKLLKGRIVKPKTVTFGVFPFYP